MTITELAAACGRKPRYVRAVARRIGAPMIGPLYYFDEKWARKIILNMRPRGRPRGR